MAQAVSDGIPDGIPHVAKDITVSLRLDGDTYGWDKILKVTGESRLPALQAIVGENRIINFTNVDLKVAP